MNFTMSAISIMSSLRTLLQVKFWSDDLIKILLLSSAPTCQLQRKLSLAFITAISRHQPNHQSIKEVKSGTNQWLKGVTITKKDMTHFSRPKKEFMRTTSFTIFLPYFESLNLLKMLFSSIKVKIIL